MSVQIRFDAAGTLVRVPCVARRGRRRVRLRMALDSGATYVVIARSRLAALGYDLEAESGSVSLVTGTKPHAAPLAVLDSFGVHDCEERQVECAAYTMPAECHLDGVIGLNYLRRFRRVTPDFGRSVVRLEPREPAD